MTRPFNARLIAVGRRVVPWVVGPVALTIGGRPVELASPAACPGLLELVSIASVRFDPDLPVGAVLVVLRTAAIVVGLAAFVELVWRRVRHIGLAAATGLAVGLSPLFPATLSPPWEAAAFGMCAVGALLLGPRLEWRTRLPRVFAAASLSWFFVVALLVPPWIVPAAAGTFLTIAVLPWPGRPARWLTAGAAAAGLTALAIVILSLAQPAGVAGAASWRGLASCTLPWPSPAGPLASAGTIGWAFGPFALALAALGLFGEAQEAGWRRCAIAAGIAILCLGLAAGAGLGPHIALAPSAVGLWWLAALGLRDLVTAMGRKPAFRFATVLVLVLLPALEASRLRAEERDDWIRPRGHEKTTLRDMRAVLSQVSSSAVFVEEDSTIDILLRASIGRRRTSRSIAVIPPRPERVRQALESGAVYAFPRQQESLGLRGFAIEPLAVTVFRRGNTAEQVGGVAAIVAVRRCQVVGAAWVDLAGAGAQGRIAMVAESEAARGPLTLYLGGMSAAQPVPDGWPERTTRGFLFGLFDQREGKRSDRLMAEARRLGLPPAHAALAEPFVVRLTLHRTPRAPLALPIVLGGSFPFGVARIEGGGDGGSLTICEAPPVEIVPLG